MAQTLHDPIPLEGPTSAHRCSFLRPLAIDHPLAGVSSFYGGVHHA